MEAIKNVVIEKVCELNNIPADVTVTGDTLFAEDLKMDSLDLIELLIGLEKIYDIDLVDTCANVGSVKGLTNFIAQNQK